MDGCSLRRLVCDRMRIDVIIMRQARSGASVPLCAASMCRTYGIDLTLQPCRPKVHFAIICVFLFLYRALVIQ